MNRTLTDLVRSMLHHKSIGKEFWAEALDTAVYVRNRVTSRGLPSNTTPHHFWHGDKPDISHLRVFGSKCWYTIPKQKVKKLDPRASEAMLLGYAKSKKAYKLWDTSLNKVVLSRDVVFEETDSEDKSSNVKLDENKQVRFKDIDDIIDEPKLENTNSDFTVNHSDNSQNSSSSNDGTNQDNGLDILNDQLHNVVDTVDTSAPDALVPSPSILNAPKKPTRASTRARRAPGEWWKASSASALMASTVPEVKLTFTQATKGEEAASWMAACTSEMDSQYKNKTWKLVPRSEARNVLKSMWVFRKKDVLQPNGGYGVKHKARIVAKGYQQVEGVDYEETYAPVVKFTTIRTVLAIVACLDLELHQMDVKTAFLNGDLDEDVYMEQQQGFVDPGYPDHVCKLVKALYGLKQAPRQWYAKIDALLKQLGFVNSTSDNCLYIRRTNKHLTIIALYVDDLLIACSCKRELAVLKGELGKQFEMSDLGEARVCLGLEITRNRNRTLHVSQEHYANKVLERFGMHNSKPVVTPMDGQLGGRDDDNLCRRCSVSPGHWQSHVSYGRDEARHCVCSRQNMSLR